MANYKVIFKATSNEPGTPTHWEPGCPLLIKAVQVARDTQTGDAYLQLKLWNLTDKTIGSFVLKAEITYQDGTRETVEVNPLDADIAPCYDYKPEPISLAHGNVDKVETRILAVTCGGAGWQSEQVARPIPHGAPLNLGQQALAERRGILADLGEPADKYPTSVLCEDDWWICPCGTPNVERNCCLACNMPLETLHQLENEAHLNAKAAERAAAERERTRKKRRTVKILSAVGIAALAVAAVLVNQFVIQPQRALQALPACYAPSLTTLYNESGEPYATLSYNVSEQGALGEVRAASSLASITTTTSFSPNEVGFPLSVVNSEWVGEELNSGQTAEVSISEATEDGLPLRATVTSGDGGTFICLFDYYPDGTLKSSNWESAGNSTVTIYSEHGFPQEVTVTSAAGEITTTTYSYSEEASSMPASCTVHSENTDGSPSDQTWGFEYDSNGNLSQIYVDGALQREFTYAHIDHTVPWTYAIAHTKPFCGVLPGLSY